MASKEDRKAHRLRERAYEMYLACGQEAVENYGRKNKLPFSPCEPCETDTPTLTDTKGSECLVCGTVKIPQSANSSA